VIEAAGATPTRQAFQQVLGLSLTVVSLLIMCWMYWRKMPDPLIDFGREIYAPWRVSTAGEVLYRDIHWFNGPLSVYTHALLFRICGANLQVIKLFNATLTLATSLLIYQLIRAATNGDDIAATLASVGYVIMFAYQQYYGPIFNNITPYSYELPHGVSLSLTMIACFWRASVSIISHRRIIWTTLAGFALGLVLLTKSEVIVAACVAASVGMLCLGRARQHSPRFFAAFIISALLPPLVVLLLLSMAMTPSEAFLGILGLFRWIGDARLRDVPFYRWLMGTDDLSRSLLQMLRWIGGYVAVFLIPAVVSWIGFRTSKLRSTYRAGIACGLSFALIVLLLVMLWQKIPWPGCLRPLPVVMVLVAAIVAMRLIARPREQAASLVLPAALVTFAGLLLAKILLNTHAFHYGFALAAPAFAVFVAAVVGWLPALVARVTSFAAAGWIPRATAVGAIGVAVAVHARYSYIDAHPRTFPIGSGLNLFYGHPKLYGPIIDDVMTDLKRDAQPGDTLVAMPEGEMLNFLLKTPNPSGQMTFDPPAIRMFGEENILARLNTHPPDWIAIANVDNWFQGAPDFGKDYARQIARWVRDNYAPVKVYGATPFVEKEPGILLMKRKTR
jgi:hypothetical protein